MGKRSTSFDTVHVVIKLTVIMLMPRIADFFGLTLFDKDQTNFYRNLVHDTIKFRETEGIVRPDMIHLLMQARKGQLRSDETDKENCIAAPVDSSAFNYQMWDNDDVTAQCFLFFLAGFETTSTLLCFTAHELMENKIVQARLIEEVDSVRMKLNGTTLKYDLLQEMKYMDMVISGKGLFIYYCYYT